jgi:hypothetical protein
MAEGGLPLARQGAYWLERALGGHDRDRTGARAPHRGVDAGQSGP